MEPVVPFVDAPSLTSEKREGLSGCGSSSAPHAESGWSLPICWLSNCSIGRLRLCPVRLEERMLFSGACPLVPASDLHLSLRTSPTDSLPLLPTTRSPPGSPARPWP